MKTLFIFIFSLAALTAMAQQQFGIRGGELSGLSYRQFDDPDHCIEVLLADRYNGLQVSLFTENFRPVLTEYSENISLYTGFGAHAGFSSSKHYLYNEDKEDSFYRLRTGPLAGVDFVCGLEYRFNKFPVTVGIDYNPYAELSFADIFRVSIWNFGTTVRYTFK
ncbi:MAG: hypothetical protein CVU05_04150 [Bacteroidetes bacterium HGW-Bacteroidetes-21]|jgi:hypothetical protein|nr:MAG: hypothetical protein CVU05_04150 [Bacteroidetes bacterium HGW-Bacteroidetes-21]